MSEGRNEGSIPVFDFTQLLQSEGLDEHSLRTTREVPVENNVIPTGVKHRDHPVVHLLKKVDVGSTIFCIIIPLFSLFKLILSKPEYNADLLKLLVCYWFLSEVSLIAGYHRFFTHSSYQCHIAIQFIMAVLGASCGFGSILDFTSQHMVHHRHIDTERDPHSQHVYGWLFSLWGHRFFRGNRKSVRAVAKCRETLVSTARATYDSHTSQAIRSASYPLLLWQDANCLQLWILTNILFPFAISKYFLELPPWNCIFYLGFVRMSIVQQQWLLVSSFCHWKKFALAGQPFDDSKSAINLNLGWIADILTFGEANHNFHHEFPGDFRNGTGTFTIDPAKWVIYTLEWLNLAKNLHMVTTEQIEKCLVQQQQKMIDEETAKLKWGIPIERLPRMTSLQFVKLAEEEYVNNKKAYVAIEGIVHDVTPFIYDHPGGVTLVETSIGKDATQAFNGAVYRHSNAARNLLATMRVAIIMDQSSNIQRSSWEQNSIANATRGNNADGQDVVRNRKHATLTRRNHYAAGAA
ncbi:unnamed protein product [Kluyveromyces dobzhanskii CBS 2104]|uniref:Acyl-CoA desaturase n=1 Tax=Kluyveromyces dobzhanskii CBS 2104 TaxID=1427455 RepID=A0A0A8L504_9SACH|nr:unnamed protein product [Kluyveromyces dobzhanskii CBS 2104]